jgi:glycosyltransferase involved in cell wall biosynthesis
LKFSIITVVYNNKDTIKYAIESVLSQSFNNIEYIIIDGLSSDGTMDIINSYQDRIDKIISEEDGGIYDAMNKGIQHATGDVIGILNSDDYYIDNYVIENISKIFSMQMIDSVFADLVYVNPKNLNKVVRRFNSGRFKPDAFAYGIMPAHPTFFVKKDIYDKFGLYRVDLKNASDFELFVRFFYVHRVSYFYLNKIIVKMRTGGSSTSLFSIVINNIEILKACKLNGIRTNILKILLRYFSKALEIINK